MHPGRRPSSRAVAPLPPALCTQGEGLLSETRLLWSAKAPLYLVDMLTTLARSLSSVERADSAIAEHDEIKIWIMNRNERGVQVSKVKGEKSVYTS